MTARRPPRPLSDEALELLSDRLRRGRELKNVTAERLAAQADVTARYVQAIEAKEIKNPGLANLVQLAAALKMDTGEFLRELPPWPADQPWPEAPSSS